MDQLSPDSRVIYDLIKASTSEEFDAKFLEYEKKMLGAVRKFVVDTEKQLKTVTTSMDSIRSDVTKDLEATRSSIDSVRDRKSTRLNSSHSGESRMPSSA